MRRIGAVLGVIALMPTSLAQADVHVGGALPSTRIWPGPAAQTTPSVPGHNATPAGAQAAVNTGRSDTIRYKPSRVTWPSGSATTALEQAAKPSTSRASVKPGGARKAGSLPVTVAGADGSGSAAKSVAVSFASRAQVAAAGIDGVVFSLSRADGGSNPSATQVSLDYSSYADAYGGGYADRLNYTDGNGNTDTRTITTTGTITAGPNQKITYDAENRTQTVTNATTNTTSTYLY